jgi:hypothetical protein
MSGSRSRWTDQRPRLKQHALGSLRTICEVLDTVHTRLYRNAVIPVALAHSSAALPLGVGQSVLRALAQKGIGLPEDTQAFQPVKQFAPDLRGLPEMSAPSSTLESLGGGVQ